MKRTKYGNTRTELNGLTFDSKKEAKRFAELKLLLRAKQISGLKRQPRYPLHSKSGALVSTYVADFEYRENGQTITEDVKSPATAANAVYKLKKKHFEADYGRAIREV